LASAQYEATFREHEIDAEVLPELTEADLEKFGVPFGHRKRLIKAIAKLGNAAFEQPEAAPPPVVRSPPLRAFRQDAERRPITVMFCDLVGSTSLAAQLDAEDWRNLVNAYLDDASVAVTGLGGQPAGWQAKAGFWQSKANARRRIGALSAAPVPAYRLCLAPPNHRSVPLRTWAGRFLRRQFNPNISAAVSA
jgi:hypothetical protein